MRQTIYIETSIPSFYYEDRSDAAAVARREWTRQWWDNNRDVYVDELKDGKYAKKDNCLSLLDDIPLLVIEPEVSKITKTYLKHNRRCTTFSISFSLQM